MYSCIKNTKCFDQSQTLSLEGNSNLWIVGLLSNLAKGWGRSQFCDQQLIPVTSAGNFGNSLLLLLVISLLVKVLVIKSRSGRQLYIFPESFGLKGNFSLVSSDQAAILGHWKSIYTSCAVLDYHLIRYNHRESLQSKVAC